MPEDQRDIQLPETAPTIHDPVHSISIHPPRRLLTSVYLFVMLAWTRGDHTLIPFSIHGENSKTLPFLVFKGPAENGTPLKTTGSKPVFLEVVAGFCYGKTRCNEITCVQKPNCPVPSTVRGRLTHHQSSQSVICDSFSLCWTLAHLQG